MAQTALTKPARVQKPSVTMKEVGLRECLPAKLDLESLTESGVEQVPETIPVELTIAMPADRDLVEELFLQVRNLYNAPNGQQASSLQLGGGIAIQQNNVSQTRVVSCPTLVTHLEVQVDIGNDIFSAQGRLVKNSTLPANAADGYFFVQEKGNESLVQPAVMMHNATAHNAVRHFAKAFNLVFGLGCEYVVVNLPLTTIGVKAYQQVSAGGSSQSAIQCAVSELNAQLAVRGSDSHFEVWGSTPTCGDCCADVSLAPADLADTNYVADAIEGQYGGRMELGNNCILLGTESVISLELIPNDMAAFNAFLDDISDKACPTIEGRASKVTKVVFSARASTLAAGFSVRIGISPCFDPTQTVNPADSYVDAATTSDFYDCKGIRTVFSGNTPEARLAYGAQVINGGVNVANFAAGTLVSGIVSGANVVTEVRRHDINMGNSEPAVLPSGNIRFRFSLVGSRLSAGSAYMITKRMVQGVSGIDKTVLRSMLEKSGALKGLIVPQNERAGVAGIFADE